MKAILYIDTGAPLVACWPEKLSDDSEVWDLCIRGGEVIHCCDERAADAAFLLIVEAVKTATGERPLVL